MYDRVYATMVDAKVSTPLEESEYYFINRYGRQVKTEEESAGYQINNCLSHPQYVLFRDEVGTGTNQMDDGNNGGQSYIGIKGMRTDLILSKASGCFTLMGLTYVTGEPVLCIYILATKSLSITDVKGFDYRASILYDSSKTVEENMVEVKALHGLPVCKFRGKQ